MEVSLDNPSEEKIYGKNEKLFLRGKQIPPAYLILLITVAVCILGSYKLLV
jgi:hypothetical protein